MEFAYFYFYLVKGGSSSALVSVDAEQVTRGNLLNHIKTIVRCGPMVTIAQGLGFPKSLLTWALQKANSKFRNCRRAISSLK